MGYRVQYLKSELGSSVIFDMDSLTGVSFSRENAMIGETLAPDTAVFSFKDNAMVYHNWTEFTYGDEVYFWNDSSMFGIYYVQDIQQTSAHDFTVTCTSLIGLLVDSDYEGNVYTGTVRIGDLIADILGVNYLADVTHDFIVWKEYWDSSNGLIIDIEKTLANTYVHGWIPKGSKRDALKAICYAYGASVLKSPTGELLFTYNTNPVVTNADIRYIEASVEAITPCSDVYLTEHEFVASSKVAEDIIADYSNNSVAFVNDLIVFDKPYQVATFRATDPAGNALTEGTDYSIVKHCNYAKISTGNATAFIVYAKPYVDNKRVLHKATGVTGREPHRAEVTDAYLVNAINSANALERLASYCSQATFDNISILLDKRAKPVCGEIVSYKDFAGNAKTGVVKSQEILASGNIKADCTVVGNWLPNHTGNNYDAYRIITDDPDIIAYCVANSIPYITASGGSAPMGPFAGKPARLVLFSGMQGGPGGPCGNPGGGSEGGFRPGTADRFIPGSDYTAWEGMYFGVPGEPGPGGAAKDAPEGGKSGRYLQIDIDSLPSALSVLFGDGGLPGVGESMEWSQNTGKFEVTQAAEDGTDGGDSSVTVDGNTYSTASGVELEADYINLINNTVLVPLHGEHGQSGDRGLDGGPSQAFVDDTSPTYDYTAEGKAEGADGAEGAVGWNTQDYLHPSRYRHYPLMGGPGSGGGTWDDHDVIPSTPQTGNVGHNHYINTTNVGTAYSIGEIEYNPNTQKYTYTGTRGANGRNAAGYTNKAALKGGASGNAGGSGGGAGAAAGYERIHYTSGFDYQYGVTLGGDPGSGSYGQQGSKGFGLLYFKE